MLTKSHIALATVVLAAVSDTIKTRIDAKKSAQLYLNAHQAFKETEAHNEAVIEYLCHMLDQNNVEVDAFDLIALHNPL